MKKITLFFFGLIASATAIAQCQPPVITTGTITDNSIERIFSVPAGTTYNYIEFRYYVTGTDPVPTRTNQTWAGTGTTFNMTSLLSGTEYTIVGWYNCIDGDPLVSESITATTTGTPPTTTDTYDFTTNPQGQFYVQGSSFDIGITYTSEDAPIAAGAISIRLLSNVDGDAVIGTYTNTVELPMGVDQTATITLGDPFPAAYLTAGGNLLASTTIAGDGSAGASAGSELALAFPGLGNYFYFVSAQATSVDTNWTPISIPTGSRFFQIEVDPSLSVSEFTKDDISKIVTSANPVESTIDLRTSGSYSIVNITGQTFLSGDFDHSINVETLNKGIYFLAIEAGVYKFVKK